MANVINNTASVIFDDVTIPSNQIATSVDELLILTKTVDKTNVVSGSVITYTIVIENPNEYAVTNIAFTDAYDSTLLDYVVDSFKVDDIIVTPSNINPIEFTISSIEAVDSVSISFQATVK